MPDTPANQAAYPQVYNQGPGLGFPIARLGAVISLACGAVVSLGFSRYAGKGEGEVSLLRRIWGVLAPGDFVLADRLSVIPAAWRPPRLPGFRGPPWPRRPPRRPAAPRPVPAARPLRQRTRERPGRTLAPAGPAPRRGWPPPP